MALSMHEQRMLEEIEQRLATDDPRLASVFSRFAAAQRRIVGFRRERPPVASSVTYVSARRQPVAEPAMSHRWLPWAVLAAGAAALAAGVLTGQILVALVGSLLVAATPLLIPVCTLPHRRRFDETADAHGPARRAWWQRVGGSRDRSRELT